VDAAGKEFCWGDSKKAGLAEAE
jgi:hypothetical protein